MDIEERKRLFEQQAKRRDILEKKRTAMLIQKEAAKRNLAELETEFMSKFGTADPAELEKLIAQIEAEEDQKLMDLVMALDILEETLNKADQANG